MKDKMMGCACFKATAIIGGTVLVGLFATATIYTGIYALNNPDPEKCWVIRDMEQPALTKAEVVGTAESIGVDVTEGYPVEMHRIYLTWFLWGFYSKLAITVLSVISAIIYMVAGQAGVITGAISCGLYMANAIIWLAAGAIWRMSKAGITASGDRLVRPSGIADDDWAASKESAQVRQGYQIDSGRFMKIYLIVAVWALGIAIVGGIIVALVMACSGPSKDGYEQIADKGDNEAGEKRSSKKESREGRSRTKK